MKRIKFLLLILFLASFLVSCNRKNPSTVNEEAGNELASMNKRLANGWNTWYTGSVLTHVLLPECFSVSLMLKDGQSGDTLKKALIGREDFASREQIIAGPKSYDGSYSELELTWKTIHIRVQSASWNNDLYLLITPMDAIAQDSVFIVPGMLWDRSGQVTISANKISAQNPVGVTTVFANSDKAIFGKESIKVPLDKPLAITSRKQVSLKEAEIVIARAKEAEEKNRQEFGKNAEVFDAIHRVLAWNTIYDPINNRVITPVSRNWATDGWVLFCWDNYFASYMFSLDSKDLAYANAIAITSEITKRGFIPNNSQPGHKSEDRSQPPVGSYVVREIYRKYQEKWFLQEVFDELLTWNRWRAANRDMDGYLVLGTDPYDYGNNKSRSATLSGTMKAAKWESGMDNSPMWDDAVFDTVSHRMLLADVGTMALYIADCQSLSEIASVLGEKDVVNELNERADRYSKKLETLWDDEFGLYLNKDLVTGKFSYRLSPTLFYPLIAKVPDQKKAERMIKEHFYNPEEFWGEFIMPTIARNDPGYKDNQYWRGRIWAPLNFLVYLGIRNYDLPGARKDMVEKSENLLLKSWTEEKHVYENYGAETGRGDDDAKKWSDSFYHWGALLGFIGIMEEGYVPSPQLPVRD